MSDFRESQEFKSFQACRLSHDKFNNSLSVFLKENGAINEKTKSAAIDSIAFNESCVTLEKNFSRLSVPVEYFETIKGGLAVFERRMKAENSASQSIVLNDMKSMALALPESFQIISTEEAYFSKILSLPRMEKKAEGNHGGIIVVILLAVLVFKRWVTQSADAGNEPGIIRAALGGLKHIASASRSDISSLFNRNSAGAEGKKNKVEVNKDVRK